MPSGVEVSMEWKPEDSRQLHTILKSFETT